MWGVIPGERSEGRGSTCTRLWIPFPSAALRPGMTPRSEPPKPTFPRTCSCLLPEPFEQGRHMHLIGLVVAGQRVHDDVDAASVGKLPLALVSADDGIKRLAPRSDRPGGRKIVGRDDDGRDAVAGARGAAFLPLGLRRQGLDPG